MTDKQLLEMAAKAANIVGKYQEEYQPYGDTVIRGIHIEGPFLWNPLEDDGDAFRLAVKLRIDILHSSHHGEPCVLAVRLGHHDFEASQNCQVDPYAATRRAIVRAAAEIGKTLI
jgi:hypothetical protein